MSLRAIALILIGADTMLVKNVFSSLLVAIRSGRGLPLSRRLPLCANAKHTTKSKSIATGTDAAPSLSAHLHRRTAILYGDMSPPATVAIRLRHCRPTTEGQCHSQHATVASLIPTEVDTASRPESRIPTVHRHSRTRVVIVCRPCTLRSRLTRHLVPIGCPPVRLAIHQHR